jgi:hypothetical protein
MIMSQIDSSDCADISDDIVGFVETVDVYRGRGLREWTEYRYWATVYQRPMTGASTPLAVCKHEHSSIDEARKCCRRLLRKMRKETV